MSVYNLEFVAVGRGVAALFRVRCFMLDAMPDVSSASAACLLDVVSVARWSFMKKVDKVASVYLPGERWHAEQREAPVF